MKQKIASRLMKGSTVISVIAFVVIVLGPTIWLEWPDVSLWLLFYEIIALWGFSPDTHKLRDLWLAGVFRIAITVWELIDVRFFTEDSHPATQVGLVILLVGTVLYVGGLALWNKWNKADSLADGPADSPAQEE